MSPCRAAAVVARKRPQLHVMSHKLSCRYRPCAGSRDTASGPCIPAEQRPPIYGSAMSTLDAAPSTNPSACVWKLHCANLQRCRGNWWQVVLSSKTLYSCVPGLKENTSKESGGRAKKRRLCTRAQHQSPACARNSRPLVGDLLPASGKAYCSRALR